MKTKVKISNVGLSGWETGEPHGNVLCFKTRVKLGKIEKRPDTLALQVDDRVLFKRMDSHMDEQTAVASTAYANGFSEN